MSCTPAPPYKTMYIHLFNEITDALDEAQRFPIAEDKMMWLKRKLEKAQQATENMYITGKTEDKRA